MRLEAEESKWETCTYFPSPTSGGGPGCQQSHAPHPRSHGTNPWQSCKVTLICYLPMWLLGGWHAPMCLWGPLVCGPGYRGVS